MKIVSGRLAVIASAVLTVAAFAPAVSAQEVREAYSKLSGRDCGGGSTCHIVFDKVRKGFRLEVETVSCVTTSGNRLVVNYEAFYVADDDGANVALYGVAPQKIGANDIQDFYAFNQQGFMPVFAGQTPRVETYRVGTNGSFTNNCTIAGHMVKLK